MRRVSLMAAVGVVSLLAVSIGVGQFVPPPTPAAPPHSVPPGYPAPGVPEPLPPSTPRPVPPPDASAYRPVPGGPGEAMTVKVYSVPDLVATVQIDHGTPGPFGANPEVAQALQQLQLQLQIQAAQASFQAVSATEPPDEVTRKLERLKKALRVAAPNRSWEEAGGEGVIEVYPEALSLIVRQTASGHEAIADLLSQLRATHDVQIELTVEMVVFEGVADELAAEAIKLLNKEMSPEELAQFRECGAKTATSGLVRICNGHSANAGMIAAVPLRFTAVASADRGLVEFRTEVAMPIDDIEQMYPTFGQSRTVSVGKTLAFMLDAEGSVVLLVTPKVVDRSAPRAM
jgi:hypothetical protein